MSLLFDDEQASCGRARVAGRSQARAQHGDPMRNLLQPQRRCWAHGGIARPGDSTVSPRVRRDGIHSQSADSEEVWRLVACRQR